MSVEVGGESGFVHATAVVVGETGILIEGVSGRGKSSLAAALIADAVLHRSFGRLVGDDRVRLVAAHGRLIARPHPAIAGLIERRGWGLVRLDHEPACVVRLLVTLTDQGSALPQRHPDEPPRGTLLGVALPLLVLASSDGAGENSRRVFAALTPTQTVAAEAF